jgi:hypothetical protein
MKVKMTTCGCCEGKKISVQRNAIIKKEKLIDG